MTCHLGRLRGMSGVIGDDANYGPDVIEPKS